MQRKTSRDKGPAPPPPVPPLPPQQSTNKEDKDKGPAPLPPVPLPILPTPPSSPLTPPSTPPFQLKIEQPTKQREVDVEETGESSKTSDVNPDILDVAYSKILSEVQSLDNTDESVLTSTSETVTVTSPEQSLSSIVVSTQDKKNTSTIIISDVADPSNSLASNISQVNDC